MAIIWIPVTERLPMHHGPIHIRTTEWRVPAGYCVGYYTGEFWYSEAFGCVNGVTHWAEMEA